MRLMEKWKSTCLVGVMVLVGITTYGKDFLPLQKSLQEVLGSWVEREYKAETEDLRYWLEEECFEKMLLELEAKYLKMENDQQEMIDWANGEMERYLNQVLLGIQQIKDESIALYEEKKQQMSINPLEPNGVILPEENGVFEPIQEEKEPIEEEATEEESKEPIGEEEEVTEEESKEPIEEEQEVTEEESEEPIEEEQEVTEEESKELIEEEQEVTEEESKESIEEEQEVSEEESEESMEESQEISEG